MRTTCLYCDAPLIPVSKHWAACPVCEKDWLRGITPPTLGELNTRMGGSLLLDKGVPTRSGRRYSGG